MATQTMGSRVGGRNTFGANPTRLRNQTRVSKLDPLDRQGSLYNLTFDEMENQLGDLGKPLTSMNLDELLRTVSTAEGLEANNQATQVGPTRQSSLMLSRDLSKKTVDEVWQDIQQGQNRNSSLDRKTTLGEMTLEDFLVMAGLAAESLAPGLGVNDPPMSIPLQAQWMSYQYPLINPHGNMMIEAPYPESQITMSTSSMMGALSDTQMPSGSRKRVAPNDVAEKTVERRQKRMIKNRESAARSRARKQAYTNELENKVSRLEEENERLRRQKELEVFTSAPPPEQKYQLRRTSSAPL